MSFRARWAVLAVAVVAATAPAAVPAPASAALRTPISGGAGLTVTLNSVNCEAQWCAVGVTVRNHGAAPRTPGIAFARVHDSRGEAHPADALAGIRWRSLLFDAVPPGYRLDDRLFYQVPDGTTLTEVVLYGVHVPVAPIA